MKAPLLMGLVALSSCADSYFTTPAVDLVVGRQISVGIVSTSTQGNSDDPAPMQAPLLTLEPVNPDSGLTAVLGLNPPNPGNVRGIVSVSASPTAPLGRRLITVKSKSGSATLEVNVKATPKLTLERGLGQRTSIAGNLELIVWITRDGTVMQRTGGLGGPSRAVPGLADIKSVAVGYAVTNGGALYSWNPTAQTLTPEKLMDGIVEVDASYGPALALRDDGRVMDLFERQLLPDITDVAAVRVTGFSQFVGGGAQYSRTTRYFLKTDGEVLLQDRVEYISPPPVPAPTLMTTVVATGMKDVSSGGFTQSSDGKVYFGDLIVHDFPARKLASTPRSASQTNGSTLSTSRSTYVLFDDGALWVSTTGTTSGSNQQGAPTFSQSATQTPVRAPGDAAIEEFFVVGSQVLIFTSEGAFISDGAGFIPADFADLRR